MKVLFITNIPAPYRIDFYNELGKKVDLTVIFEAKGAKGIRFNWNIDQIKNFKAIFLSEGNINERKVDCKIFKYIKKDKYDHIVLTNYSYFTEMAAMIYMKIMKIPYYFETDGGLIRNENFIKRIYKKFLVSNARGYFSPSSSSDEYLKYYGAKKDIIYRYPFTSLKEKDILINTLSEYEKETLKNELGIKEKKIVLSVGQFIYRKGYDTLLKACKDIDEEIGVYIIGGKATKEYLQLKEDLNLKNIYFEEFKSNEELNKYYKVADIFVLPTREDIWGLVINESMANGLPVITTDKCVAGLELVKNGENGNIININRPDEISMYINKILYNENINLMREKSLEIIREYTIENMAKEHLNVFKKNNYNNEREKYNENFNR